MNDTNRAHWRNASGAVWTGRVMSGLFVLFMLGVIELVGTLLYVLPRTAILGAVILTGLLGGSMATQIRIENQLFSHILFSVYLGLFMLGGLWLRNSKLRALLPIAGR